MTVDIDDILMNIDSLRAEMTHLGRLNARKKYIFMFRLTFVALCYIYACTGGYQRPQPSGHDLLFYIYLAYIL
jgi:hypothetical protein